MNKPEKIVAEALAEALTYPVDAFISREYAEAEPERLWSKVWQQAGRVEEVPEVGNFITYNICHDSILIVRDTPTSLKAYHNVCPHRGRRLVSTPPGAQHACGTKQRFVCGFHGWAFNLDGKNAHVLDPQDWKGALNEARTSLAEVKVDTWGGWIFINMDPNCESLREFLELQVQLGLGKSSSDYVLRLLRRTQRAEMDALETKLLASLDSGPSIPMDAKFWEQGRARIRKAAQKRGPPSN
jgi:nitrite reductase/ring-hydroxylating ferredoxin subunit/Arc/MetJ-type ribon-helix-helix transcriptional regulator